MYAILEARWKQYKQDFLRANRCTPEQFESAYIAFVESSPDAAAYRKFARKWHITIIPETSLPELTRLIFSVNVSAIKVMAKTYQESVDAIEKIIDVENKRTED